jgi:hypothetical protein
MAAEQSLNRQKAAFQGPIFVDGLVCVLRTGGPEPTAWGCVGRDLFPIKPNKGEKKLFHSVASGRKMPAFSASVKYA